MGKKDKKKNKGAQAAVNSNDPEAIKVRYFTIINIFINLQIIVQNLGNEEF